MISPAPPLKSSPVWRAHMALNPVSSRCKKPSPSPLLEPWMSRKFMALCCDRTYEDAAPFSRELVERMCRGFDFLVPYYRYFEKLCRPE